MANPLAIIGGLAGAIGGGAGSGTKKTTSVSLAPASELEKSAESVTQAQLSQLEGLVGEGPGTAAVQQGTAAQNLLASDLERLRSEGLRPTGLDIETAQAQLEPARVAAEQSFEEEQIRAQRLAAQLNRPINDPIIQAKLSQERIRSQERLGAQESALAVGAAGQRLGFSQQLAGVRQGLATQALQNRLTLASLGQQVLGQQQAFRTDTATRTTRGESGGGIGGAISGAFAGAGSLIKAFGGQD